MFRGSGFGSVQNSNYEHLQRTIYRKKPSMEAKGGTKKTIETEWAGETRGRAESLKSSIAIEV